MVVVVKMKKLADYKQVFDHFLSAFPPSCFVIPFEDLKRRDFICNYLQLDYFQCLILDKKGTDMKKNILLHGNRFVGDYGADAFPFTDEKLQELQADEEPRWKTCSTNNLVGLLRCKLSDVLKKTNAEDGCGTVTISDLNNKDFVGLFLCIKGDLIPKLKEVYQHCKTHHKSFEILLVYMPMLDSLDPQNYKLFVDNQLQKHNLSLWYMPFDNSVSRKLYRLVCPLEDELIILGTQDGSIDPYGREVLITFGINAYPFTRKELVQREVNKFKELTLETLLVYESQSYLLKGNTKIPVADLRGKNVLLWMSSLSPKLSEVMPWLVCPFIADHSASIEKKLFPDGGMHGYDALVEFGTDGLVCSFTADEELLDIGVDESGKIPFGRSNLRRSAIKNLHPWIPIAFCVVECHFLLLNRSYGQFLILGTELVAYRVVQRLQLELEMIGILISRMENWKRVLIK
uniref:Uncharacterized protein n=1 Tax=Chenopodium quinoa TaxID=63459 RepID=A0A803MI36_CHEQI